MTTTGTSHFVSMAAALQYYRPYGFDLADVKRKHADQEIHIGPPAYDPARQHLTLIDGGTRYAIVEMGELTMLTPHTPRFSYLFRIEYRTRTALRQRNLYIVSADATEAAHEALRRAHGWHGVVGVDRAIQLGRAVQCSGN